MSKPINHPAFPVAGYPGDAKSPAVRPNSGMAIRDYFASAALQGLLLENHEEQPRVLAAASYTIADAMLEEREKFLRH